jgi:TBC1 domain family member 20
VLYLTLPPELQLPCAEQMSLQRLRDAMGKGLEPIISQLQYVKHTEHTIILAYVFEAS